MFVEVGVYIIHSVVPLLVGVVRETTIQPDAKVVAFVVKFLCVVGTDMTHGRPVVGIALGLVGIELCIQQRIGK